MLSVELTSRCSCYVFRPYLAVKRVQCPPDSSAILLKQPKQLNLIPRFPRSTVQYDNLLNRWRHSDVIGSMWQFSRWLWWIMRVVLPNQGFLALTWTLTIITFCFPLLCILWSMIQSDYVFSHRTYHDPPRQSVEFPGLGLYPSRQSQVYDIGRFTHFSFLGNILNE